MISRVPFALVTSLGWMSLSGTVCAQQDSTESALDINPWNFSDPKQYVIAGAFLEEVILIKGFYSILLKYLWVLRSPYQEMIWLWPLSDYGTNAFLQEFQFISILSRRPSLHSAINY